MDLGKVGYLAYHAAVGGAFSAWETLTPQVQHAWRAAVVAGSDARDASRARVAAAEAALTKKEE